MHMVSHQDFTNIYMRFAKTDQMIKPNTYIKISGHELHEFLSFGFKQLLIEHHRNQLKLNLS